MADQLHLMPLTAMQVYLNTLQQAEAELSKLQPADEAEEEEVPGNATSSNAHGGDDGAAWDKGNLQVLLTRVLAVMAKP